MIPRLDARKIATNDPDAIAGMREAATEIGFATIYGTGISGERVREILSLYRSFFLLPEAEKAKVDMARTGGQPGLGRLRVRAGRSRCQPRLQAVFRQRLHPAGQRSAQQA